MFSGIIIYQTEDRSVKIDVRLEDETVWLSLEQIAALFQRDKSTVSRHIKNVLKKVNFLAKQLLQRMQQFKLKA